MKDVFRFCLQNNNFNNSSLDTDYTTKYNKTEKIDKFKKLYNIIPKRVCLRSKTNNHFLHFLNSKPGKPPKTMKIALCGNIQTIYH